MEARMFARAIAVLAVLVATTTAAFSHSWYQYHTDPVFHHSCCGGQDCAMWAIQPGELSAEDAGYRVRLSLERTRYINPNSIAPIDALVIWDRVQPSEDGNWHLCIANSWRGEGTYGIYCLFAPPNI
jgi:hypothetical protein